MSKKNKVDKGFELIYWNLSYRRKFIRTVWMIPFGVLILLIDWLLIDKFILNIILTLFIVISLISQLSYTYLKWKKNEQYS